MEPKEKKSEEEERQEHIDHESNNVVWNTNPDGCWYCGSYNHHTADCPHKDE